MEEDGEGVISGILGILVIPGLLGLLGCKGY